VFTAPTPSAGAINSLGNAPAVGRKRTSTRTIEALVPLVELKKPGEEWKELQGLGSRG